MKWFVIWMCIGLIYFLAWMARKKFWEMLGREVRKIEFQRLPKKIRLMTIGAFALWVVVTWPHSLYCDIRGWVGKK